MTAPEYNKSVDQYSDNLYRFIVKNVKDKDLAKDIVQDTYEKLWRNHAEVDNQKVKSWLFTTGYHTMIDRLRKENRQVQLPEHFDQPGDDRSYKGLKEILNEALEKLPSIQKTVVLLRDYEGYNYEEIGEITGLTEAQVKVYIFRARVALKNFIGKLDSVI
jgi:RNA polymerase sigma factor (sigma-70 family)